MQPLSSLEVLTGTACTHNVLSQGGQRLEQVSRLRRVDGRDEQDGGSSWKDRKARGNPDLKWFFCEPFSFVPSLPFYRKTVANCSRSSTRDILMFNLLFLRPRLIIALHPVTSDQWQKPLSKGSVDYYFPCEARVTVPCHFPGIVFRCPWPKVSKRTHFHRMNSLTVSSKMMVQVLILFCVDSQRSFCSYPGNHSRP